MWLSKKWMQKVMLGTGNGLNEKPLLHSLIKLRLGRNAYIGKMDHQAPVSPLKTMATPKCPVFIRKAFKHSVAINDAGQLKELFVICERNSMNIPGEQFPEIWKMFDVDLSFSDLYLRLSQRYFQFLSIYSDDFSHFDPKLDQKQWKKITLGQKKMHLLSQFAWSETPTALQWINALPSTERVAIMKENIYRNFPDKTAMAKEWASTQSKKATEVAHVYLLKDKKYDCYQKAIEYVQYALNNEEEFLIKDETELPFPVFEAGITKGTATPILKLIAWLDPEDVFGHLDFKPTQLSEVLMDLDENEAWIAHILHGAIYHKNEEWIKYALEMVRYYDLVNVKYHEQWPKLLRRIPPAIIISAFKKSVRKAQNDLDRIDAIQHWLFPADLFISRELTEKLWSSIGTGLELIAYGELSLEHYKDLFTYIQNRMHPAIAGDWERTKGNSNFTANFQDEVKRRYFLYKSLNQWLKVQQNN